MKCVELAKNPVQKLRNSYGFPRIFRRHRSYLLGNTASVVQSKKNNSTPSNAGSSFNNESEYCMIIVNPGNDQAVEYTMPSHLERSWRAKGTDQDIIFLKIG